MFVASYIMVFWYSNKCKLNEINKTKNECKFHVNKKAIAIPNLTLRQQKVICHFHVHKIIFFMRKKIIYYLQIHKL